MMQTGCNNVYVKFQFIGFCSVLSFLSGFCTKILDKPNSFVLLNSGESLIFKSGDGLVLKYKFTKQIFCTFNGLFPNKQLIWTLQTMRMKPS